ncbi:MAG TPA: alpha-glucosidase [Rikenellaceae bacterium]|nr:alpha-glucosidase [Rikenellaceae bacterium]
MKHITLTVVLSALTLISCSKDVRVNSPDGSLSLKVYVQDPCGTLQFDLSKDGKGVIHAQQLGLTTAQATWKDSLRLRSKGKTNSLTEEYTMTTGKRLICSNTANTRDITVTNQSGDVLKVEFRLFNDGLAFRYELPEGKGTVTSELTSYSVPDGVGRWIQTYHQDGYEDFYPYVTDGHAQGRWKKTNKWGYPALVEPSEGLFTLITEADITRDHCGSYLDNEADSCLYRVVMADDSISYSQGWKSPWRVLISGSLDTIVESTLVTDVSEPCTIEDTSWIKPGPAAWIYWAFNHGSSDFKTVCEYIDLAAEMGWPYDLIDAEWDTMSGGGDILDALKYAESKGVKPMIWYNSSTNWINGAPTPHYRLNTQESREKEYTWLNDNGVAGIKVDFFHGDNAADMNYYLDLMEDAARHHLLINFHGATLPRGGQRTYPHLMTMEAVYGAEWYNNLPILTEAAACHNATLPFTRNVVGSMDYTPGTFSDSQHPHITSDCHELALPILFESGIQHMPDRPSTYLALLAKVRTLLATLPTAWDDTRFIAGYPGENAVLARKSGDKWYIAGINGTDNRITMNISLDRLKKFGLSAHNATIFTDTDSGKGFVISSLEAEDSYTMKMGPRGGFVIILE